ncbi:MAG: Nif3-like dinuclear metal center hexameric protein [Oscillospiraceae bacterium]|nr:Nif3-like dinuclear metal center hexameric protein [Oscillospiraceae bacterium]
MPTVREIETALYEWAPRELAESWDNVGLLVGSADAQVHRVLIALDVTEWVAEEAIRRGAELIVAHHPVMNCRWHEVQSVVDDNAQGRVLMRLLQNGVSAICMHTNLDAAEGGVNDVLARLLGLEGIETFNEEKIGRIGTLKCEKGLEEFLQDVVQLLGCKGLRYRDAQRRVHRVAVGGGACVDYAEQVRALGCDTFVTSDVKYHEFLDTSGINLIDAGHFETENPVCTAIRAYLSGRFPQLEAVCSTSHAESVIKYFMK